jgi:hypothetical protein
MGGKHQQRNQGKGCQEAKTKDTQNLAMSAQIKILTDAFKALTMSISNKENVPPRAGNMNTGNTSRPFNWTHNMGRYCWLHGHHPVSVKHSSSACTKKTDGHKDYGMATNCQGGDNFWPNINTVKESQQDHPSFKGKLAPTN